MKNLKDESCKNSQDAMTEAVIDSQKEKQEI